jgi:putative ABC transport system ATP-binding protein
MTEYVIEAKGLSKTMGTGPAQVQALRHVDLVLPKGSLTLLMGPSGSGKTTLLSILGCMLTPTSGTVTVCGNRIENVDAEALAKIRRRYIGFVFQSYHLFETLSALENVQIALELRDETGRPARAKAMHVLAELGLADKASAVPAQLSGGEQQRVAIARAIVGEPAVILADEPTAALDGKTGQSIMSSLATITRQQNSAALVVTHDTRLLSLADRIVEIEDGALKADAPPPARKVLKTA